MSCKPFTAELAGFIQDSQCRFEEQWFTEYSLVLPFTQYSKFTFSHPKRWHRSRSQLVVRYFIHSKSIVGLLWGLHHFELSETFSTIDLGPWYQREALSSYWTNKLFLELISFLEASNTCLYRYCLQLLAPVASSCLFPTWANAHTASVVVNRSNSSSISLLSLIILLQTANWGRLRFVLVSIVPSLLSL